MFERIFANSPDALVLTEVSTGKLARFSEGFLELTGYSAEEVAGRSTLEIGLWTDPEARCEMVERLQRDGRISGFRVRFNRKDGRVREGLLTARFFDAPGGRLLFAAVKDMTEVVEAERARRDSQAFFQRVFEENPDAMALARLRDRTYLAVNAAFERLYGAPRGEVLAAGFDALTLWMDPAEREAFYREFLASGRVRDRELAFRSKDGNTLTLLVTASRLEFGGEDCLLATARDVTALRQQEEAHRQAQKLESLGLLAGGIAHDFNNLFQALLGNLNLVQLQFPPAAPLSARLQTMERTLHRAEALARQMLIYAGRGRITQEVFRPDALVLELAELLESSVSKKSDLVLELEAADAGLRGDPSQIQQVLLNLVLNAAEAYGSGGGRVTVRSRIEELHPPHPPGAFVQPPAEAGRHYLLEVEDHGAGMDAAALAKIFDPFFSTKAHGRGLGLSAILGILRAHRGGIQVQSASGEGTSFRVFFPLSDGPVPEWEPETTSQTWFPGRWRVLLADDEDEVRASTGAMLEALGCAVVAVENGEAAVQAFLAEPERFDLLILDATMPVKGGGEALQEIRARWPEVKAVLTSGFTSVQDPDRQGTERFLKKPYGLKALRETLAGLGLDA